MKTRETPQRGLRFAEAGILFLLVLGLTVFVGVRVASRNAPEQTPAVAVPTSPAETAVVQEAVPETAAIGAEEMAAEETLEAAAEPEPAAESTPIRSLPVTYAEAEAAYLTGGFAEAVDLFDAYTTQNPHNAWGHYMLGMALWKAGDPEQAEESFLAALEIVPDHAKSLVNHGRVLLEMERYEEARTQVEKAVAADPANLDARRVLGRVYYNLGLLEEAEASYREVLRGNPDDGWSLNNLGLILIQEERFASALPALAKAALLMGDVACVRNNLGVALERTGHLDAAAGQYELADSLAGGHQKARQSMERLAALGSEGQETFDLAAAAAGFDPDDDGRPHDPDRDLEVAATVPSPTGLGKENEDAGDQDR